MSKTFLYIGHDSVVQSAIQNAFEDQSVAVFRGGDGRAAAGALDSHSADVILLDITSQPDWQAALDAVREAANGAPVIVLAPTGKTRELIEARRHGACDCLLLPLEHPRDVQAAVERALHGTDAHERERSRLARLEQEVRHRTLQLEEARRMLEEKKLALREVLGAIESEKRQVGDRVVDSVETLVLPLLQNLRRALPQTQHRTLEQVERSLQEITSPYVNKAAKQIASLSPTQLRISHHIRRGLSIKDIAGVEGISLDTVGTHRRSIRRKLGITHSKLNLVSYLGQVFGAGETA